MQDLSKPIQQLADAGISLIRKDLLFFYSVVTEDPELNRDNLPDMTHRFHQLIDALSQIEVIAERRLVHA